VPNDSLHPLQPNKQAAAAGGHPIKTEMSDIKTEADIKTEIKEEPMDIADIKPNVIKSEIKIEKIEPGEPVNKQLVQQPAQPPIDTKALKITFSPEELKAALEPPLMKMYNQEPEAIPFRIPVDPGSLGIPDYFEIIKKPMDMCCIKRKLDTGVYKDPWEFVDDVYLMFENAWTYNRKSSRVFKYCLKVIICIN
jgi:E1A/CREB-binding protein